MSKQERILPPFVVGRTYLCARATNEAGQKLIQERVKIISIQYVPELFSTSSDGAAITITSLPHDNVDSENIQEIVVMAKSGKFKNKLFTVQPVVLYFPGEAI